MVKKIRVCANYDNSENLTNRLLRQFLTPEINLENIVFVYDDSYDVIVFFNHVNMEFRSDSKAYVFPHEPSWNGSHQKVFSENTTIYILVVCLWKVWHILFMVEEDPGLIS